MSGSNRTIKGIKGSRGSELNKTIRRIFARAEKVERAILTATSVHYFELPCL